MRRHDRAAGSLSTQLIRNGCADAAEPAVDLRAGAFSVRLCGAELRNVYVGGAEVVRSIHVAVRDRNWGTVPARVVSREIARRPGGFRVRLEVEHAHTEVAFRWYGEIDGSAAGGLSFTMDGVAGRDFLRNRIGICVLHPMELAGTPVGLTTPSGKRALRHETAAFPTLIAPHQPFRNIGAMRHEIVNGCAVELRFTGEVFETEDQRNWTDASFKTYGTPLSEPFPVLIRTGEPVRQSVEIKLDGIPPRSAPHSDVEITVSTDVVTRMPAIGLTSPGESAHLSDRESRRLHSLRLGHLRVELDAGGSRWADQLTVAAMQAQQLDVPLEIAVVATGAQFEAVSARLAALAVPLVRVLAFDHRTWVTSRDLAQTARRALDRAGVRVPFGGGSFAWFAQLNRSRPPLSVLSELAFSISPQVHVGDEATMLDNIAALAPVVAQARGIAEGRPLAIGPVTLKPRFQPTATGDPVRPATGELPASVDPRQISLLAAGWLVGSLRHLAVAGVGSLTLFETAGCRGVMELDEPQMGWPALPGGVFPVFHVLVALGAMRAGSVLTTHSNSPQTVAAFACANENRLLTLVANLTASPRAVRLQLPDWPGSCELRLLDDHSVRPGLLGADTAIAATPLTPRNGATNLNLPPYALGLVTISP